MGVKEVSYTNTNGIEIQDIEKMIKFLKQQADINAKGPKSQKDKANKDKANFVIALDKCSIIYDAQAGKFNMTTTKNSGKTKLKWTCRLGTLFLPSNDLKLDYVLKNIEKSKKMTVVADETIMPNRNTISIKSSVQKDSAILNKMNETVKKIRNLEFRASMNRLCGNRLVARSSQMQADKLRQKLVLNSRLVSIDKSDLINKYREKIVIIKNNAEALQNPTKDNVKGIANNALTMIEEASNSKKAHQHYVKMCKDIEKATKTTLRQKFNLTSGKKQDIKQKQIKFKKTVEDFRHKSHLSQDEEKTLESSQKMESPRRP